MLEQAIKTVYIYLSAQIKTSCLALRQLMFFLKSFLHLLICLCILCCWSPLTFFIDDELCLLFTLHMLQLQCVPSLPCEA